MQKIALFLLMFFAMGSFAQPNLQDQINAVHLANKQQRESERLAAEAAEKARLAEQERQRIADARRIEVKLLEKRQADAYEEELRKIYLEEQRLNLKQRQLNAESDSEYEKNLRMIAIEKEKAKLAEIKAKAERANDYIDQDLKSKAAETDLVQSVADSNRNISEGAKVMMIGD